MDLATIQIKVDTREVNSANDAIGKLGRTGTKVGKDVNAANDSMTKSYQGTTSAVKLLGTAMAALGVGALINSFRNTVTETERLKGSLVTMTGSTENAAFAFDKLLGFASTTPFTLDQSVEAFTKLTALGLDPSERALASYGNTAAAMGKDMMQMIEAVADASTGEFERLKEFGIKAKTQADQVSFTFQGVTTTVGKNAEEIQNYLLGIGEVNFGGAMEDQMKRLPGLLSNLSDQVTKLFLKIGDVGGIKLFAGAIGIASTAIAAITDNLDLLGIALAAVTAGMVAFSAGSIAASIISGFGKIKAAVIALNFAIKQNPIAFVASAITTAAVVIIAKWDSITSAATKSAINIEIAWNKLKLYLMGAFAPALDAISGLFRDVQNQAVATWTAVAAAARDPLNAIDAFNETFDETLESLRQGEQETSAFSASVSATESRIAALESELETLNTEVEVSDEAFVEAQRSLSDFKVEVDETAVAAAAAEVEMEAMRTKALEVLGAISNEQEALHLSNLELDIRNNLQKAGVDATSELGQQIVEATTALHNEKTAIDAAAAAAKKMEEDVAAAQKAFEEEAKRIAEEMEERHLEMTKNVKGFLIDLIDNGRDAFDNLGKKFKEMIANMLLDWASSKIAETILNTFNGIGSSVSGIFSGIFSSIGSGIAGLASQAASVMASVVGGGGAAAAGGAAAGAGAAAASTAGAGAAATSAGVGAKVAGTLKAAGATIGSAASKALAVITGPVGIATMAAGAAAALLDKGGTPTSAAGITMAKTPGMQEGNVFQTAAFESGFAPLGFKQNATNAQAEAAIKPLRELDATLTALTEEAGFNVNLSGHTFSGLGVEGTGAGTLLGTFIEEGKVKGTSMEDQMGQYAKEWVQAVGVRNNIEQSELDRIIGDGTASTILSNAAAELEAIKLAKVDGSHESGLAEVPYDGYVAELHAGERVLTAQQADAADTMATDFAALRGSIEEIMIAVARNTAKSYRLYDRWDKNGLPPERAA